MPHPRLEVPAPLELEGSLSNTTATRIDVSHVKSLMKIMSYFLPGTREVNMRLLVYVIAFSRGVPDGPWRDTSQSFKHVE